MTKIGAHTRLAGVIGDPVRHSLSPVLHNAAYGVLGLDWIFLAFEVAAGATEQALDAARALGMIGLSVTMPHKSAAAAACDECTPRAAALKSVNMVTVREDGSLAGDSTDGEGFLRSLREEGFEPAGVPAVVLGGGGAARAVALALTGAGASVTLTTRRPEQAEEAAAATGATARPWDGRVAAVHDAVLVVNATPIGMGGDPELPVPAAALQARHVVADLVYHPARTPLLAVAVAVGARAIGGLGMLVHQAALQVEGWSGRPAPVEEMRRAALAALTGE